MAKHNLPNVYSLFLEEPRASSFKKHRFLVHTNESPRAKINQRWIQRAIDALVVFLLNGKGRDSFRFPLYFEVTFNPTIIKNPKLMTQFWLDFESADTVLQAMIKDHVRPSKMQSVYIPAEAGTILGPILSTIPNRVDKIKALLIQMYRRRNPRFCSHYTATFMSNVTYLDHHVMYPFWDCISLGNTLGGACGNCVWQTVGNNYE
ncbi:hypothetical protein MY11210_007615 [Beauveria gryllotalpidicola]